MAPVVRARVARVHGVERFGQPAGDLGGRGPARAGVVEQQARGERAAGRGEDPGRSGARALLVDGPHLPAHAVELLGHLVGGAEPVQRIRVRGAQQQPVQRLVPQQQRMVVGQLGRDPASRGLDAQCQHRERATDGVEVGCGRELRPDDLRGVVADVP